MRRRIGIFGGTFDPPHLGHLILADEAYYQLSLDQVLWVLTPVPPHKPNHPITPLQNRLDMLEAAIAGDSKSSISMVDINRSPPHYAVETMLLLAKSYLNSLLFNLIGGDSLRDLPTWHKPLKFIQSCDGLGVMRRPGVEIDLSELEERLPGLMEKVQFIETPMVDISASQIRNRVREGRPFRYYLPEQVYQIIKDRRLYIA